MPKIKFTKAALEYLKRKHVLGSPLLLIVDDGGGKYSILGGSCTMGSHFSIIKLKKTDPDYPIKLENDQNVEIYTSNYDLAILQDNLVLDYINAGLELKNDSGILDGAVQIGDGEKLLAENSNPIQLQTRNC